jgi:hypothetical protein
MNISETVKELRNADMREDIKNLVKACRHSIGTKYTNRKGQACEVVDVLLTFNATGEWTDTKYVVAHTFMGQDIIEKDVNETTIARRLFYGGK